MFMIKYPKTKINKKILTKKGKLIIIPGIKNQPIIEPLIVAKINKTLIGTNDLKSSNPPKPNPKYIGLTVNTKNNRIE